MNTTESMNSITFDPDTNTYQLCHDSRSEERITETVIRAVAIVTNTPPTDFDPLYDTIDPDALARLFTGTCDDASQDTSWASFRFSDCTVHVYATGMIEITPDEDATPITAPVPDSLRDR